MCNLCRLFNAFCNFQEGSLVYSAGVVEAKEGEGSVGHQSGTNPLIPSPELVSNPSSPTCSRRIKASPTLWTDEPIRPIVRVGVFSGLWSVAPGGGRGKANVVFKDICSAGGLLCHMTIIKMSAFSQTMKSLVPSRDIIKLDWDNSFPSDSRMIRSNCELLP